MQAHSDQRPGPGHGLGAGLAPSNQTYGHLAHGQVQYSMQGANQSQVATSHLQNSHVHMKDTNSQSGIQGQIDNLSNTFGAINVHGQGITGPGRMAINSLSNPAGGASIAPLYYQLADGRVFISGVNTSQSTYPQNMGAYSFTPAQAQYLQQANYHVGQSIPNMHQVNGWNGTQQYLREVPELAAPRRTSFSSNEENGPHTPFFGAQNRATYPQRVLITDNSPQAWTTPSPEQLGHPYYPQPLSKSPDGQYSYCDLDAVCRQHPAIPKPVPAIFSGEKARGTLEKSLNNTLDTTNVYIRGLQPDTTDEMLHAYGVRFGDIVSAKSMLDQQTGLCKGFGFIKYHSYVDGENCIRGFFHWGYEAKWARVSHNEKLKTLGDPDNTNLYVANLPATFNEAAIKAIFVNYDCISAKILRDPNGLSRGVGFARFATPAVCDEIITAYNGKVVGAEGNILSIRYADTENQKMLKTDTAAKRQYKTHEYNVASGSPLVSPVVPAFSNPFQTRFSPTGYWPNTASISPLNQTHSLVPAAYMSQVVPVGSGGHPQAENVAPTANRYPARLKIESPSVSALAKRTKEAAHNSSPSTISGDEIQNAKKVGEANADSTSKVDPKSTPSKSSMTRASPSKSALGYTPSKL